MTKAYGTSGSATWELSRISKDLTITTAKHKIRVEADIWKPYNFHECYVALYDSSGVIIPVNGYDSDHGTYLYTQNGHYDNTLVLTSGINFTVGEVITVKFGTTPWDPTFPMYFYSINLSEVD